MKQSDITGYRLIVCALIPIKQVVVVPLSSQNMCTFYFCLTYFCPHPFQSQPGYKRVQKLTENVDLPFQHD